MGIHRLQATLLTAFGDRQSIKVGRPLLAAMPLQIGGRLEPVFLGTGKLFQRNATGSHWGQAILGVRQNARS